MCTFTCICRGRQEGATHQPHTRGSHTSATHQPHISHTQRGTHQGATYIYIYTCRGAHQGKMHVYVCIHTQRRTHHGNTESTSTRIIHVYVYIYRGERTTERQRAHPPGTSCSGSAAVSAHAPRGTCVNQRRASAASVVACDVPICSWRCPCICSWICS